MNTILLDFDGVIRLWTGSEISSMETALGLDDGSLFKLAFSDNLLLPAITGAISDEAWRSNVQSELIEELGSDSAKNLMLAWESSTYKIDFELLNAIKDMDCHAKIVLASNATSRLNVDLKKVKLDTVFDVVVNSSEIGIAKPNINYFTRALAMAECSPHGCIYIDDDAKNVNAAIDLGIRSELYTNADRALQFIKDAICE